MLKVPKYPHASRQGRIQGVCIPPRPCILQYFPLFCFYFVIIFVGCTPSWVACTPPWRKSWFRPCKNFAIVSFILQNLVQNCAKDIGCTWAFSVVHSRRNIWVKVDRLLYHWSGKSMSISNLLVFWRIWQLLSWAHTLQSLVPGLDRVRNESRVEWYPLQDQ